MWRPRLRDLDDEHKGASDGREPQCQSERLSENEIGAESGLTSLLIRGERAWQHRAIEAVDEQVIIVLSESPQQRSVQHCQ